MIQTSDLNYVDDVFIEEKIDGIIYLMARPSDEHIYVQGNISYIFSDYFRQNKKFCVIKNEAQLYYNDNNYFVPDLMVFCFNTSKDIPMIIIEVLSESTYGNDLGIKMKKYAELGIKEYWIVDCKYRTVTIYVLNLTFPKI